MLLGPAILAPVRKHSFQLVDLQPGSAFRIARIDGSHFYSNTRGRKPGIDGNKLITLKCDSGERRADDPFVQYSIENADQGLGSHNLQIHLVYL